MKKIKNVKIKTQQPTFTKSDLKTGDAILHQNGKVGIVMSELNTIVYQDSFGRLGYFHNDLTIRTEDKFNVEWDIVAVRRPVFGYDCQFCAFEHKFGTLVYQRFE